MINYQLPGYYQPVKHSNLKLLDVQHGIGVRGNETGPVGLLLRKLPGCHGDEAVPHMEAVVDLAELLVGVERNGFGRHGDPLRNPASEGVEIDVLE